jgi:two-component system chemotaxis sensor kinase CheA
MQAADPRGVLAALPGATLVVGCDGLVREAFGGPEAPVAVDDVVGAPIHAVLGLDDDAPEAGALQLWLACSDAVPLELWRLSLGDPPKLLPPSPARPGLALEVGPVLDGEYVTAVALHVRAATPPRRRSTAIRAVVVPDAPTDPAVIAAFARSAADLLAQCEAAVTRIAADQEARGALHRLFRAVHTIKGEASVPELRTIRDLAHAFEDDLATIRAADRPITPEELAGVTDAVARLRAAIVAVAPAVGGLDAMTRFHEHARPALSRMQRCLERWALRSRVRRYGEELVGMAAELVSHAERSGLRAFASRTRTLSVMIEGLLAMARVPRSVLARIEHQLDELDSCLALYQQLHLELATVENGHALLDELRGWRFEVNADGPALIPLMALSDKLAARGVLAVARALEVDGGSRASMIPGLISDAPAMFAPPGPDAPLPPAATLLALRSAGDAIRRLAAHADPEVAALAANAHRALQRADHALTRMSLEDLAARTSRTAHELGTDLGKQVIVDVDAIGVRVGAATHRTLSEVLVHAVRNALDHGLETPAERQLAGKPAAGKLEIQIDADENGVVVEIRDDGRGVDLEAVRRRALERGLLDQALAELATEASLLELLFEPGFSTAAAVTMVSGRGVGLDAIRALCEERGGAASMASKAGVGTTLRLELPDA